MEQAHQFFERLFLSTGQAARHFQASISALKSGIRDGWLVAFKSSEGHCRKELEGCSADSDSMGYVSAQSLCYIFVPLFPNKNPSIAKLCADILADDLRSFHLDTTTDGYDALIYERKLIAATPGGSRGRRYA